jgi:hypothetical protein
VRATAEAAAQSNPPSSFAARNGSAEVPTQRHTAANGPTPSITRDHRTKCCCNAISYNKTSAAGDCPLNRLNRARCDRINSEPAVICARAARAAAD